ncbi:hypothetical protein OGAPHI_003513 [Ogataea philodendri]|uniref:Uncharacterized protein n=1 Tax=Ogataea philodendri TaxID=1378263 RepID=A0A9P8P731_9ASCO|nr:uncharacterized protein OGAPHI_003513 [Ogataea philodendri]KAH3666517.1 hypothetical protein OGAPHI_003513 [Ogataea philodendri]
MCIVYHTEKALKQQLGSPNLAKLDGPNAAMNASMVEQASSSREMDACKTMANGSQGKAVYRMEWIGGVGGTCPTGFGGELRFGCGATFATGASGAFLNGTNFVFAAFPDAAGPALEDEGGGGGTLLGNKYLSSFAEEYGLVISLISREEADILGFENGDELNAEEPLSD